MRQRDSVIEKFLETIHPLKGKVQAVYLFGSRARGMERPDSDYDLLLRVNDHFSLDDKAILYDGVMDILLDTGRLISLKIFKEGAFQRLCRLKTPFMSHILAEGIRIG